MAELSEDTILEALKTVTDPDSGRDVVSAGMISGVNIRDGRVNFALSVDPDKAGDKEPLRQAAEQAVANLDGVEAARAVLTAERAGGQESPAAQKPQSPPSDGGQGGGPSLGRHPKPSEGPKEIPGVKSIIAVASGKGGVGKSTTAVNLALVLAKRGMRVGLLDADIYGPSIPRMMGITGKPDTKDEKILPMERYGIKTMSIGYMLGEDQPVIWRGPMVMGALQQLLNDVNWGELDVMVVDLPPGTGDAQLSLVQSVPLTGAVIVSTPQDIALTDARKGLKMFEKVETPVFGIIENMSYFICPSCGEAAEIFGYGGAQDTALELGTEFLGEIPLHINIRETSDKGTPIVESYPDSPESQGYFAAGEAVAARLEAALAATGRAPNLSAG